MFRSRPLSLLIPQPHHRVWCRFRLAALIAFGAALFAADRVGAAEPQYFQDWRLECADVPATIAPGADLTTDQAASRDACYIFTALRNNDDNTVIVAAGVRYFGPGTQPLLLFQLIPDIDRESGIRFAIDDGPAITGEVRECDDQKCIVFGRLSDEIIQSMKAGSKLVLLFRVRDEDVLLDISLFGFTAAYGALTGDKS